MAPHLTPGSPQRASGAAQAVLTFRSPETPEEGSGAHLPQVLQCSPLAANLRISGHQLELVRLLFEGATEGAIASELGISPHTVHTHIERIHQKLSVSDRVELVMRIFREFIALTLDPESDLPSIRARRVNGGCSLGGDFRGGQERRSP